MSTASPRPQLSLDELRRLKWLLGGLMALVSLWTVFFLDVEALTLVGLAGGAIVAALVWPQLPARVPAWGWRLAVPAIIAASVADWYVSKETLPVLIRLGVLLVLYRTAGYRRQREDLQLIVLGLFLIVVAGVLTVSLGFAVLLLVFTACALGFLFVVTLIDMSENTRVALTYAEMSQCPGWARGGWRPVLRRLWLVADWRLLGFSAALFTAVVLMSGLLFLVIPRFEVATGFFLDKYITRKSRTGFTETVRFGDVGELVRDESVAMRIDVPPAAAALRGAPYWRLVVLDEYTREGFHLSTSLKNELLRSQRVVQVVRGRMGWPPAGAVPGTWTFYVEPGVSRFLPLPGGYGTMRLREYLPIQTSGSAQLAALRVEAMAMTAFQLDEVDPSAVSRDPLLTRQLAARAGARRDGADVPLVLRSPAGQANRAALDAIVAEITGGQPLRAADFARRATAWLQRRHAYALGARIPRGDKDDIVKWVESNEPGFCEYFAGGLAVLCRAAGIPSRVIAGFHGGALNAYEHYYMVKNADAHAWTEVFDETGTWQRFDPTPGSAAGPGSGAGAAADQVQDSSWSARFDSLRVIWYRRIVNFDSRQQVELVEGVRSLTLDTGGALKARLAAWSAQLKRWAAAPWDVRRLVRAVGQLAAVGGAAWLCWQGLRLGWRRWRAWRQPGRYDPIREEAGRWLGRIAERGLRSAEGAGSSGDLRTVVGELQRLRYGRKETWPEPRAVFRRARQARRLAGRRA